MFYAAEKSRRRYLRLTAVTLFLQCEVFVDIFPLLVTRSCYYLYILIIEMSESSLLFQVCFNTGEFLWLVVEFELAVLVLSKIP